MEKVLQIALIEIFSKQKPLKFSTGTSPRPAWEFIAPHRPLSCVLHTLSLLDFLKCLKNIIFPQFLVNTLFISSTTHKINWKWKKHQQMSSITCVTRIIIIRYQGLRQAVFDIGIPILGTIIWVCPNLILSKTKTTVKHSSSFLIKSAT